jgi:hypothetical protein
VACTIAGTKQQQQHARRFSLLLYYNHCQANKLQANWKLMQ